MEINDFISASSYELATVTIGLLSASGPVSLFDFSETALFFTFGVRVKLLFGVKKMSYNRYYVKTWLIIKFHCYYEL